MISVIITQSEDEKQMYMDNTQPLVKRVNDLVSRMTLEEKVSQMSWKAPAIERLGVPESFWWNQCLHGVCSPSPTTMFPVSIAMAATWNPDLIHEVATAISDEARALYLKGADSRRGKHGLFYRAPVINISRDPRWGRINECFGEDPYLTARIAVSYVKGLQGGHSKYLKLVSTLKHFAANNEEWRRLYGSSEVSERILREYWLPHFRACVMEANAMSIMGAYNAINGEPCCTNKRLLTDILRGEWGFDGFVVSDTGALFHLVHNHHSCKTFEEAAAKAVKAGIDLDCEQFEKYLVKAVKDGLVSEEEINTAVVRILTAKFRLGIFDPPEMVPYNQIPIDVIDCEEHRNLALRTAHQAIVLLRNDNNFLPLDKGKVKSIAVIGPHADKCYFGSYSGVVSKSVTTVQGIRNRVSAETQVWYAQGCEIQTPTFPAISSEYLLPAGTNKMEHGLKGEYYDDMNLSGRPLLVRIDDQINFDWRSGSPDKGEKIPDNEFSIRWRGKLIVPTTKIYTLAVGAKDGFRLFLDGNLLIDRWSQHPYKTDMVSIALEAGKEYDIQLEYFKYRGSGSVHLGWDYLGPSALELDQKVQEAIDIAQKSDVVILALGTDGSIESEGRDREDIDLPQTQLNLLKKICKINPNTILVLINGGPLSIIWAKDHVPAILEAWYGGEEAGNAIADVIFGNYNPGGKLPYTVYKSVAQLPPVDEYDITKGFTYMYLKENPLFPFGHGLSYTKFDYRNLEINPQEVSADGKVKVSLDVQNIGHREGDEVVQLYVRDVVASVKRPNKELRGFERITIEPSQTKTVSFILNVRDLAFYDVDKKSFVVEPGKFELLLGSSSEDIRLKGDLEVITGKSH